MSAKPLLFAGQHHCWQQRVSKEKLATYDFHDADFFKTHYDAYPN